MANIDAAYGFRPVRSKSGDGEIQMGSYEVAAAYATALFEGCPVMRTTDGTIVLWATTNKLLGFAAQERPGAATTANTTFLVYDDPDQVFAVQVDDNTIVDEGDIANLAFGIITPGSGVALTGKSIAELDGDSGLLPPTLTLVMFGLRLSRAIDDDPATINNSVYVKIAPGAHELSGVVL